MANHQNPNHQNPPANDRVRRAEAPPARRSGELEYMSDEMAARVDETRAYLVLVDPGSVKDPESFSRVVSGVAPAGEGDDRQIRRRRRRRKRRG